MNKENIKINISLFIFLFVLLTAVLNDIVIYLSRINYNISLIISLIIIGIMSVFLMKKKIIKIDSAFSKTDLFCIIFYIVIGIYLMTSPDVWIDTIHYHIYNQENIFMDKIGFDLLPNSSFFMALGDRVHFIFRNYLGYNFGSVFSVFIIFVIFYEIKKILKVVLEDAKDKKLSLYASICTLSISANMLIALYNIDSFSTVLFLELVYIFIKNKNLLDDKRILYYISLLSGLLVSIKISNIILVIAFAFIYLIKVIKEDGIKSLKKIKIYDYFGLLVIFVIPFMMYMINSYIQTGNLVFPFYNNIFKSKYYNTVNGKDLRFGAKNICEIVLWPILILFNPGRANDMVGITDVFWTLGFIISIFTVFSKNKKLVSLSLIGFLLTYMWVISMQGFVRYALVIPFVYYIINIYILDELIIKNKDIFDKNCKITLAKIFSILLLIIITILCFISILEGIAYLGFRLVNADVNKYINLDVNKYDITDSVWISNYYNNGYVSLIRKDDPILNSDISYKDNAYNFSDYSREIFENRIKDKKVYTVLDIQDRIQTSHLEESGFKIKEIIKDYNDKFAKSNLKIVEVEYVK